MPSRACSAPQKLTHECAQGMLQRAYEFGEMLNTTTYYRRCDFTGKDSSKQFKEAKGRQQGNAQRSERGREPSEAQLGEHERVCTSEKERIWGL